MEDLQFVKNFKVDKTIITIIRQANHKDKNLNVILKSQKN